MILSDTSILIRAVNHNDPQHSLAVEALATLRSRRESMVVAPQNLMEFWAVATRPCEARGGLGLSHQVTLAEVRRITESFLLLPETPDVFVEWLSLVDRCAVSGKQVHDARLAAWMRVNGVGEILTFNVNDFQRYPGITALHPQAVRTT